MDRGGNGLLGDGIWPETDGRGCPMCGAIGGGGHGGGCALTMFVYDEDGCIIHRNRGASWDTPLEYIEADLERHAKPVTSPQSPVVQRS